jgi:hypothetical protein
MWLDGFHISMIDFQSTEDTHCSLVSYDIFDIELDGVTRSKRLVDFFDLPVVMILTLDS